jgi:omega-6 fatty acid desaturase (delta-12 desaturase)
MTLIPYHHWKKEHSIHHATSGLLDRRGHGDIDTLTVTEYDSLSWWRKMLYRLYRHPVVLFGIGPPLQFIVKHRVPFSRPRRPAAMELWSIWGTNAAIVAILVVMGLTIGMSRFLMVQLPITLIASSIGVWLFYVQHQFEETYWRNRPEWEYFDAALAGSSYLDLGPVLQWFTGNIGLHHIHHLASRIPNYRLQECLKENPDLECVTRLTLLTSLRCARLTLWDEENEKLISFRDYRNLRRKTLPA